MTAGHSGHHVGGAVVGNMVQGDAEVTLESDGSQMGGSAYAGVAHGDLTGMLLAVSHELLHGVILAVVGGNQQAVGVSHGGSQGDEGIQTQLGLALVLHHQQVHSDGAKGVAVVVGCCGGGHTDQAAGAGLVLRHKAHAAGQILAGSVQQGAHGHVGGTTGGVGNDHGDVFLGIIRGLVTVAVTGVAAAGQGQDGQGRQKHCDKSLHLVFHFRPPKM